MRRATLTSLVVLALVVPASVASAATGASTASVAVRPSAGLVNGQHVRVSGSGFVPAHEVLAVLCEAGDPGGPSCLQSSVVLATADSSGAVRFDFEVVSELPEGDQLFNCTSSPGACVVSVGEYPQFDAPVSAPISFSTIGVISRYRSAERDAVQGAQNALGLSAGEVQRLGVYALAWTLGLTGTGPITPVDAHGSEWAATDWTRHDDAFLRRVAAAHGVTPEEFQKTGALFVAYELAIS